MATYQSTTPNTKCVILVRENGRWTDGVRGTLNQTGRSDTFASTFSTWPEAIEALKVCEREAPGEYKIEECA